MRKRAVRISILTFLLTASVAAAFFLWDIQRRSSELTLADDTLAEHLEGITTTVGAIATAQQGYVAPGQLDEPWFERMTMLLEQLNRELAAMRLSLRTADAVKALDSIGVARKTLVAADERIRENLTLGQELMAADVIFSDGRNSVDAISTGLHEVRTSEASRNGAERAALDRERWIVLGLATLAWFAVVVVLMSAPASATAPSIATVQQVEAHPLAPAADANTGQSVDLARNRGALYRFVARCRNRGTFGAPWTSRFNSGCVRSDAVAWRRRTTVCRAGTRLHAADAGAVWADSARRGQRSRQSVAHWPRRDCRRHRERLQAASSRRCLVPTGASVFWHSKAVRTAMTTRHCKPWPRSSLRRSRRRSRPGRRQAGRRRLRRDPLNATFLL